MNNTVEKYLRLQTYLKTLRYFSVSDGDLHLPPPDIPALADPLLLPGQLHPAGPHQQPAH